eukprot:g18256.t1
MILTLLDRTAIPKILLPSPEACCIRPHHRMHRADGSQEITISEKPNVVPGFFVARHVRLHFAGGAWPQVDGKALSLCVGVVKVWRLAPPLFRQRFLEIFRKLERKAKKAHSISAVPRFWSTAVHGQSFNMVINMDLVRRLQKSHDFKGDDLRALLKMAVKDKKDT